MARHHNHGGIVVPFTAEEEAAFDAKHAIWVAGKFDREMAILRERRNILLAKTDFYALSDVTMSEDMTTYRQALRNLPEGLTTVAEVKAVIFPTKP